jgi:hypothetical protein
MTSNPGVQKQVLPARLKTRYLIDMIESPTSAGAPLIDTRRDGHDCESGDDLSRLGRKGRNKED